MKRKSKRTIDRHAGKRQTPFPHEHDLMSRRPLFGRPAEGSPAEEAGETAAQEGAERDAGTDVP